MASFLKDSVNQAGAAVGKGGQAVGGAAGNAGSTVTGVIPQQKRDEAARSEKDDRPKGGSSSNPVGGVTDAAAGAGKSATDAGQSAGGAVGDAGKSATSAAGDAGKSAGDAAKPATDTASDAAKPAADTTQNATGQAADAPKKGGGFMSGVTGGISSVGSGLTSRFTGGAKSAGDAMTPATDAAKPATDAAQNTTQQAKDAAPKSGGGGGMFGSVGSGISSGVSGVGSGVTSGVGMLGTGAQSGMTVTADLAKSGGQLASDATSAGVSIGQKIGSAGLDVTGNVLKGTTDLTGTALGGLIDTAAATSGKVFEPVASGLKAIEGLDKLGEGLEYVNGLPVAAVKQVGSWTVQALNMSGKTPTFFDTNGDGVVKLEDTTKGLLIMGLDEAYAKYAAYALHAVFCYSTGTSWIMTDPTLPITIANMGRTRWGKNWGSYERMDWVDDIDINTFFTSAEDDKADGTWKEKFTKSRQYFGVLLLIFEWGTTWPFMMPDVPLEQMPFKDEIGKVVRSLVVPTIFNNFQRARDADPNAQKSEMPDETPKDHKDA